MLRNKIKQGIKKYFLSTGIIKKKRTPGVFNPFIDPYVCDIVAGDVHLVKGWHAVETSQDELWRWMEKTAVVNFGVEGDNSYFLIHYIYSLPSIGARIEFKGDRGCIEFEVLSGNQVIVINRNHVCSSSNGLISMTVSERYPSGNDSRELGLMIKEIGASNNIGGREGWGESILTCGYRIKSKPDLDRFIGLSYHMANHSDECLLHFFTKFSFEFPTPPADPNSDEYLNFWLNQYNFLHDKSYDVNNEKYNFSDDLLDNIYPYNTKSPRTIGDQLIAAGSIVKSFDGIPIGSSVLEMGVGWGTPALQLALSGYRVTVLDIEEKYLNIVKNRFSKYSLPVEPIHGDYFSIFNLNSKFDVIVFYESFHHCIHHRALLLRLKEILRPGGSIIFAGETVTDELPYDWGLNPTGQGIWSISHHGWMELCFNTKYFLNMLDDFGFSVTDFQCPQTSAGRIFKATCK
ncbi:class I SAM-dependent methyltransferase [Rhodoferax sp. GW822-FHT02A01]|uniref:class I SAM-dependent methyltransferase n=1 Tax=Rhodoferax sp. GW822-FHT02A01 TaxID=3141537 RepID=UPI00315D154B